MHIDKLLSCHGVVVPVVYVCSLWYTSIQFKSKYKIKRLDSSVDDTNVVIQLYNPFKMSGLLEYSYGILYLKCLQLDDAFDGNILL